MNTAKYVGLQWDDYNCWELVREIYKDEFHIDLPEKAIQEAMVRQWIEVKQGFEHEYDLLLFDTVDGPHVGLAIGNGRMIHSDEKNGVITERYKDAAIWKHRLKAIYRRV